MLSRGDNEFLTRTGPGTPMGEFMRRFWIPVAVSSELAQADGDPMRIRVLGEDLVAFRDSEGRIGLLDEHCPHRLASLYFGRNEECGIRCIYYGWKFDVTGACVDTPTEPPTSTLRHKIKAKAYPARERGGIIWAYMGPGHHVPALPEFEWMDLPETHRHASRWEQSCNFFQALEGEFDTAHVGVLHRLLNQFADSNYHLMGRFFQQDSAPKWHIEQTDYGLVVAARRDVDGQAFWRMNQYLLPFYSMVPEEPDKPLFTRVWLPRDDETSWVICVNYRIDRPLAEDEIAKWRAGISAHRDVIPGTTRPKANRENDYLIDRALQRTHSFSGIAGIRNQDAAAVESAGPIVDRSREHLGTSDAGIIQVRRRLMEAARALQGGEEPIAARRGELYRVRAGQTTIPCDLPYSQSDEIKRVTAAA
jgi:phenylpropionate dioxygenase-like ring-hydroxylating dioxygenase large terminal subunit